MSYCQKCGKRFYGRELKTFVDESVSPVKLRKFCKFCYLSYRNQLKKEQLGENDGSDDIL